MYLFPLDTSNSKLILHPKNDRSVTVRSNSISIFIGAATSLTVFVGGAEFQSMLANEISEKIQETCFCFLFLLRELLS